MRARCKNRRRYRPSSPQMRTELEESRLPIYGDFGTLLRTCGRSSSMYLPTLTITGAAKTETVALTTTLGSTCKYT